MSSEVISLMLTVQREYLRSNYGFDTETFTQMKNATKLFKNIFGSFVTNGLHGLAGHIEGTILTVLLTLSNQYIMTVISI